MSSGNVGGVSPSVARRLPLAEAPAWEAETVIESPPHYPVSWLGPAPGPTAEPTPFSFQAGTTSYHVAGPETVASSTAGSVSLWEDANGRPIDDLPELSDEELQEPPAQLVPVPKPMMPVPKQRQVRRRADEPHPEEQLRAGLLYEKLRRQQEDPPPPPSGPPPTREPEVKRLMWWRRWCIRALGRQRWGHSGLLWWLAARPLLRGLPVPVRFRHSQRGRTEPESLQGWADRCRNSKNPLARVAASHWSDERLEAAYTELQWFHRTIGYVHYPVINLFEPKPKAETKAKAKKKASMRGAGVASTA